MQKSKRNKFVELIKEFNVIRTKNIRKKQKIIAKNDALWVSETPLLCPLVRD